MLKKICLLSAILTIFMVMPVFADKDCNTGEFVGTYTRLTPATDIIGDGELHAFVYQLTFHADGTVTQNWTGFQDYQTSAGTGSINIGAWKCRPNGNVLVTLLYASYTPTPANPDYGTVDDVKLLSHTRLTAVFNLNNNNTITRIKSIVRTYAPAEDPSDPNGGTLGTLSTTQVQYKRFVASGADLNEQP